MYRLKKLVKYWPIGVLFLFEVCLFVVNYVPGTYLTGWDNVMPEFNFQANIIRNFSGVWQEHRGVGLYDGMSHISNLLHTLFLWILSIVLPLNLLRYVFTFLIHFLGGVGIYKVLQYLKREENHASMISLIGALFYELNIATIIMFFTPLESFSVHFAILPWFALMLISYLNDGTKKSLLWFLIIAFLGTAQFFITTLLAPITILLGIFSLHYLITSVRTGFVPIVKRVAIIWIGFLLINSFWLLPYIYGLPKNVPVIQSAKINQQSTPEAFARNFAFGDLRNVLLLRGFVLDSEIIPPDSNNSFYMMEVWRSYINTPGVLFISYIIVGLVIIGIIKIFINKNSRYVPYVAIFSIGFFMLGNDVIGLRSLNEYLRSHVSVFNEAFRFPFTKFSLLYVFAYSILAAYGVTTITTLLKRIIRKGNVLIPILLILAVVYISFPVWKGNFIFPNMRIKLPQEYLQVFNYMQAQEPNSRVALLPQVSYWSFKQYDWGYYGSGFLWYGIPQPTLDRAFDPWSIENENYYWELSRALYTKKPEQLDKVFNKYNIRFIVLDENLVTANNYPASLIEETKKIISEIPNISQKAVFGKLTIYERTDNTVENFISIKQNLPLVWPPYHSNDNDIAYQKLGDYINNLSGNTSGVYIFPYRSLFTKRSSNEREFKIVETNDQIQIFGNGENTFIPKKDRLVFDSTPTNVLLVSSVIKCGGLRDGIIKAEKIIGSNEESLRLTSLNQRACLSFGMPNVWHKDGYLLAIASKNIAGRPPFFSVINQTTRHIELETYLPVPTSNLGKVDWLTTYFILPPLAEDGLGYTFYLANDSIGKQESINDILHVYMYRIPYEEIIQTVLTTNQGFISGSSLNNNQFTVEHPNPSLYIIKINDNADLKSGTLYLSQSFDSGWQAWIYPGHFPLQRLENHVKVDNWANGWEILPNQTGTIIIFFWPQLLEWSGFVLMGGTFIFLILKRVRNHA